MITLPNNSLVTNAMLRMMTTQHGKATLLAICKPLIVALVLCLLLHYDDVIMSAIASPITSLTIVYSTVYPGADQSKHQSSASLAFV